MKRNIITIDEDKCNGCGLCVNACHEGALQLVDGKAKLVSESYCDGLGDCLPECPTGAIKIEEREALPFDKEAVERRMQKEAPLACGCPSAHAQRLDRKPSKQASYEKDEVSELGQWPCQIKLVPASAPYFSGARLLVAADCTAFAFANIHSRFMKGKITLIGCPRLDMVDYTEKLTEIIKNNDIKSVDVLRMSVPCCGGIENAVRQALINSGKMIPWSVTVISPDGGILE
ncbi:MAG: 4Fe-4S binding protein [Christensenellales bacterium]|jgi:ferredoxin